MLTRQSNTLWCQRHKQNSQPLEAYKLSGAIIVEHKLASLPKLLAEIFNLIQGVLSWSYVHLVTICVKQKLWEWKCTLAAKDSTTTYNTYVTHWSASEYLSEKTLWPGPLYLFKPRKDYPIPQKLTLTTVAECWNLCIMHLWRNMQIRAILVLCLSMLILHSHPANSQRVNFSFIKEKSYFYTWVPAQ